MSQQVINRGSAAGDGTGENLFDAFGKVNTNFTELYNRLMAVEGFVPVTSVNYPALVEGWEGKNMSGSQIVGVNGLVNLVAPNGWIPTPPNTFAPTISGTINTVGTFPPLGNKHIFLVAAGHNMVSLTSLGSSAGKRISLGPGALSATTFNRYDGSNYGVFSTLGTTSLEAAITYIDQRPAAGSIVRYVYQDEANQFSQVATITGDVSRDWGALATGVGLATVPYSDDASQYLYGLYLLAFDNFPTTIDFTAATKWMALNHALYPGFIGLS